MTGGPLSYRNQSIDLQSKSMDFLYENGLCHERVNEIFKNLENFIVTLMVMQIRRSVNIFVFV